MDATNEQAVINAANEQAAIRLYTEVATNPIILRENHWPDQMPYWGQGLP